MLALRWRVALALLLLVSLCAPVGRAEWRGDVGRGGEDVEGRKYAPDRIVDVLRVKIDVTPDFDRRSISATTVIQFEPIAEPVRQIALDAVDLAVSSVTASHAIDGYTVGEEQIVVTFVDAIPVGADAHVEVAYTAAPRKGLYFRTAEMGYPEEDTQLWTQGETYESRHWFPSFDYPNERFSSEVICHAPTDMTVVSNGRLLAESVDDAAGLKTSHWLQEKPHVNYLIALVVGRLAKLEAMHGDLPMAFYVPTTQAEYAANSFRDTADIMAFFEEEIGVPYPWDKYDQVVVLDFHYGGMENTSLTALTEGTLFGDATENLRDSRGLVAHELAHQWFGDYVTCKDWSHVWLNEGFATYYDWLHAGHRDGPDETLWHLYSAARGIVGNSDRRPMVSRDYKSAMDQFGYRAYPKGAWVLHMLRTQLGTDLYRRCVRTYLERHALGTVVTEDLNSIVEELSGRSFDRFFDQYVYHARHPELSVSYAWDEQYDLAKITAKQTHEVDEDVLLFQVATKVRFDFEDGLSVERDLLVTEAAEDFYFPLDAQPQVVRFDPDLGVLAKVSFDKPTAMLYAQLEDAGDVVGRLRAVTELKAKDDPDSIERLQTALNEDAFHAVRTEASKALREIHTAEAFDALLASTAQPDARVRKQVVSDLGGFYKTESRDAALATLDGEQNPDIVGVALGSLGKYGDGGLRELLRGYLASESYRNRLAVTAIGTIRTLDDPAYIELLRDTLTTRGDDLRTGGLGTGLRALGYLARNEEDKEGVRAFLTSYVQDLRRGVRIAAIDALGELRDPRGVGAVQTFTGDKIDGGVRRAAEKAIKSMRDAKSLPVALSDVRDELLDLKEQHEELAEEFAALKELIDATEDAEGGDSGVQDEPEGSIEDEPDAADAPMEGDDVDAPAVDD
jgi:aminopeptidase N